MFSTAAAESPFATEYSQLDTVCIPASLSLSLSRARSSSRTRRWKREEEEEEEEGIGAAHRGWEKLAGMGECICSDALREADIGLHPNNYCLLPGPKRYAN